MAPLNQDTIADKILRFVLGALVGGVMSVFYARTGASDQGYIGTVLLFAGVTGLLAVLLGNRFIEWVVRRRWRG
jgi:hypothetical protein